MANKLNSKLKLIINLRELYETTTNIVDIYITNIVRIKI